METVNKIGLGLAVLVILALGVTWFGHASNDDTLFQFGVVSIFVLSLLNGVLQVGRFLRS
jgi:hypothetical protein